jgi:hypothetical protein
MTDSLFFRPAVIGTVAEWFTAVGTIGAVIVALYFGLRDRRTRVLVSAIPEFDLRRGLVSKVRIGVVNLGMTEFSALYPVGRWGLFFHQDCPQIAAFWRPDPTLLKHSESDVFVLDAAAVASCEEAARRSRPLWFLERHFPAAVRLGICLSTGEVRFARSNQTMRLIRAGVIK